MYLVLQSVWSHLKYMPFFLYLGILFSAFLRLVPNLLVDLKTEFKPRFKIYFVIVKDIL